MCKQFAVRSSFAVTSMVCKRFFFNFFPLLRVPKAADGRRRPATTYFAGCPILARG